MPRFTLLALTEADVDRAKSLLPAGAPIERHGAYLTGVADEAILREMMKSRLLLNAEPEASAAESAAVPEDDGPNLLGDASDDGMEVALAGGDDTVHQVLRLDAPLTAERLGWLKEKGVHVGRRLGPSTYLAKVDTTRWDAAAPAWMSLTDYSVEATLGPALMQKAASESFRVAVVGDDDAELLSDAEGGGADGGGEETFEVTAVAEAATYDVSCHERARLGPLFKKLKQDPRVHEVVRGESRLRLVVAAGPDEASLLSDLGRLEAVDIVERYVPPEPLLSYATAAVLQGGAKLADLKWRGEGQTIGIADSGVDAEHPDLKGRVTVVTKAEPASDRDPLGHGTHVASIAAGDGTASNGKLAGLASKAKIYVQSLADENQRFQVGVGITALLREAYQAGVRVQNFSWGSDVGSRYTMDSKDLDEFVYDNPEMLIVVACGNTGVQETAGDPPRIALRSLAAPGNAKNCLAVGASCSPRPDGPYANQTWASYDGRRPPTLPPMSSLPLTGNADVVASMSSRGPSDDGRLKPDLVAPGVGIAAARSFDSSPNHVLDNNYCFMTGTSMAAPLISGAAAVVRQYYIDERQHTPSAALLKATLINGAQWVPGEVWEDPQIGQPNFHQGFGRFALDRALPLQPGAALLFEDIDNKAPGALQQGDPTDPRTRWSRKVTVGAGQPFSITMVWTDPPPRGLQHELDLVVVSPTGQKHVGNEALVRLAFQAFDSLNNVEQVRVTAPEAGEWMVHVFAKNTFRGPQGFAVAMTGALS